MQTRVRHMYTTIIFGQHSLGYNINTFLTLVCAVLMYTYDSSECKSIAIDP